MLSDTPARLCKGVSCRTRLGTEGALAPAKQAVPSCRCPEGSVRREQPRPVAGVAAGNKGRGTDRALWDGRQARGGQRRAGRASGEQAEPRPRGLARRDGSGDTGRVLRHGRAAAGAGPGVREGAGRANCPRASGGHSPIVAK